MLSVLQSPEACVRQQDRTHTFTSNPVLQNHSARRYVQSVPDGTAAGGCEYREGKTKETMLFFPSMCTATSC